MTYSTGAGDYNALMAAVLAHAVTDGWTTTGGNWPISKGLVQGVDWTTFTATEADRTLLGGATKTARYLRIAIGTSGANATANAAADATSAQVANMEYSFTSWHIFSDPTVSDHIHVVCNFSNGINSDCYTQFSFGVLDKHGMSHTGIVYVTGNPKRAYSTATFSGFFTAIDYAGGPLAGTLSPFTGRAGYNYSQFYNGRQALQYIIRSAVSPVPAAGWPAAGVLNNASNVLNPIQPHGDAASYQMTPGWRLGAASYDIQYSSWAQFASPQPYSGAMSMAPLPFLLLQNLTTTSQVMFLGSYPNVRLCSMESYAPQTIITYGAEEWMVFPMLRSTPWAQMQISDVVSSGRCGFAFKKVP